MICRNCMTRMKRYNGNFVCPVCATTNIKPNVKVTGAGTSTAPRHAWRLSRSASEMKP